MKSYPIKAPEYVKGEISEEEYLKRKSVVER